MKSKKWVYGLCVAILLFILFIVGLFLYKSMNRKEDGDTIVKDNVRTITSDMDYEKLPESVTTDRLVFGVNPKYKKGDVVVAGNIPHAESGFIRRVTEVKEVEDKYVIYTESAVLTDVFEKAHIVKRIQLTEDDTLEANYTPENHVTAQSDVKIQNMVMGSNENYTIEKLAKKSEKARDNKDESDDEDESEYLFGASFEAGEGAVKFEGDAGVNIWLEVQIDIEDGEIECGMAIKKESGVNLNLHSSADAKKKIDKTIYSKSLPKYEFFVAGIPIVITNRMDIIAEMEANLEGDIGLFYEITYGNTLGFQYSSRTGKISSINEKESDTDGLEWNTLRVSGKASGEIGVHLVSKLYDCSGVDISAGVRGKAEGEAKVTANKKLNGYAGSLELEISPMIEGELVVDIPIFDKKLKEYPLFEVEMKPFWSKKWESSANWKEDLKWMETGEKANTYITRYGEINLVTCPTFQFEYPNGWSVKSEEVGTDIISEKVVLTNERGVTVTYWSCQRKLGGSGNSMLKAEIEKADSSAFVPSYPTGTNTDYSSLGNFMVAKVRVVGEMLAGIDYDYIPVDKVFFAVVPESYIGEREFMGQAGNVDEFSFEYPSPYAFIAESPDGEFTTKEENDVVKILKSFKVYE